MTAVFIIVPALVGLAVGALALNWALTEHRVERLPWKRLLEQRLDLRASGIGVFEGVVLEQDDQLEAPFSGKPCLAYRVELVGRTHHLNEYTYQTLFSHSEGNFSVKSADVQVMVDFAHASELLPPSQLEKPDLPARMRLFGGSGDRAPERIQKYFADLGNAGLWNRFFNPNRDKVFEAAQVYCLEHRVEADEALVLAGQLTVADDHHSLAASEQGLFFGRGSLESERQRAARLPIAGELFGAVMAAVIAAGLTGLVLSIALKDRSVTPSSSAAPRSP